MPNFVSSAATGGDLPRSCAGQLLRRRPTGPSDQISIRGDTRSEKTNEQKNRMVRRIMREVPRASGGAGEAVSVALSELPAANFAHYGRIVPEPGDEDAWFSSLPDALQERLRRWA
jgi:phenylpyruvate tautomerase PptA (4-oxalocrotonate tautomerase family)